MNRNKIYLAVDLGAGSGRVLAGEYDQNRIDLHELNRFENKPVSLPDGWHWDVTGLYLNILEGLKIAANRYGDRAVSVGIDTWGVDYALIDKAGCLTNLPYQYRDSRTDNMMELAYQKATKRGIYEATGIQFMFFNSIFQLLSEVEANRSSIHTAEDLLFIPDLLAYWLTGKKSQERTIASTSQLYNPNLQKWDYPLIEKLGIPKHLFKEISEPGTPLGQLTEQNLSLTGFKALTVVTAPGHDTASAVAAVPSQEDTPAYLSSGTWSLMGLELKKPIINDQSYEDSFTNEMGINNSVRFLKNICGLWLIQESRRYWQENGEDYSYSEMGPLAEAAEPFRSFVNPDDESFVQAGKMPEKIQNYCSQTNQPIPETPGQIIRCIYESLALRYLYVWEKLIQYTDTKPSTLHIVGGGCQDKLLNQFTANALGVTVKAGPVEATGLGNILSQMLADQTISSISEGRQIVAKSFEGSTFSPQDIQIWKEAYIRFSEITRTAKPTP